MDVFKINAEMVAIVDAASSKFFYCSDKRRRIAIVSRAKRQINKINKDFKRAIDTRSEGRPGTKRFSINQRESLEVCFTSTALKTSAIWISYCDRSILGILDRRWRKRVH